MRTSHHLHAYYLTLTDWELNSSHRQGLFLMNGTYDPTVTSPQSIHCDHFLKLIC